MTPRLMLILGAVAGFLTVAFGAFAAHALKRMLDPASLTIFHTGVDYQGMHALALLACGILALQQDRRALRIAAWSFALGILIFSGSLYALALSGQRWLGAITPLGGTALLIGWASLTQAALGLRRRA